MRRDFSHVFVVRSDNEGMLERLIADDGVHWIWEHRIDDLAELGI
jgi:hypothetical protein